MDALEALEAMTDVVLVLTTVPDDGCGEAIARTLVEEHLAACVNLHAPMDSVYRWKGVVEHERERQLVIKTTRGHVPALRARIEQLHAYELPEFVVIAVIDGSPAYLEWIRGETARQSPAR